MIASFFDYSLFLFLTSYFDKFKIYGKVAGIVQ